MSPTSELIKRLRKAGLSQSEIARRTGIPQPRISRWESAGAAGGADDVIALQELEKSIDSGASVTSGVSSFGDLSEPLTTKVTA